MIGCCKCDHCFLFFFVCPPLPLFPLAVATDRDWVMCELMRVTGIRRRIRSDDRSRRGLGLTVVHLPAVAAAAAAVLCVSHNSRCCIIAHRRVYIGDTIA